MYEIEIPMAFATVTFPTIILIFSWLGTLSVSGGWDLALRKEIMGSIVSMVLPLTVRSPLYAGALHL